MFNRLVSSISLLLIVYSCSINNEIKNLEKANNGEMLEMQLKAQKCSVANIKMISMVIRQYFDNEGRTPRSLAELTQGDPPYVLPSAATSLFYDGWERPFYYQSSKSSYFIASFGCNGMPDSIVSPVAGGWSTYLAFDADIAMIDGTWAQSPEGVPR